MMKRLLLSLFLFSVVPSFACDCDDDTISQELVIYTDIIVRGEVLSTTYVKRVDIETGEKSVLMKVGFLVTSIYKGSEISEVVEVYTDGDNTCGVEFQKGMSYILFGYYSDHLGKIQGKIKYDVLYTNICMMTQLYSKDVEDRVKELIEPQ